MPDTVSLFNPDLGTTINPNVLSAYLASQQQGGTGIYEGPISPKYGGSGQTGFGNQFDEAGTGIVPGSGNVTGLDASGAPIYDNGGTNLNAAAGLAGSVGSLGQSASNLYFDVASRQLQKKMLAQQQQQLLNNYNAQQVNAAAELELRAMQAQQQQSALASSLGARGVGNSSIATQSMDQLNALIHGQLAAQQRQMALNTTNYNTQEKLLQLQAESAANAYDQQMLGQGFQAGGAALGVGLGLLALL